jgi:hypothetical protein
LTKRKIDFVIKTTEPNQKIPVRVVVDKLSSLQAAVIHLGDYIAGGEFRARGRTLTSVSKKCTLVISDVKIGSFAATLELRDSQRALEGGFTLGEEAIGKLREIMALVESEENIKTQMDQILRNPLHRRRIIEDLAEVWPEEEEHVDVEVTLQDGQPSHLTSKGRLVLEGLLSKTAIAGATSVKGILGTVHVLPGGKYFRVVGPDGHIKCNITKEQEEGASRLIGKPAIVFGEAVFDEMGNVKEIVSVEKVEPFQEISLQRAFSGEEELALKEPITIGVDYQDDNWVMTNDDLGIVSASHDYDTCLQDFQDELLLIWEEYGKESDSNLTVGARKLKELLVSLVRGETK